MTLDPQTIDILKWFGLGIGWLITTYVTYRIGRRVKHDDIQIRKRHNFAEQLSVLLQKISITASYWPSSTTPTLIV